MSKLIYQKPSSVDDGSFITDPSIPDPENLPIPLGWNVYVRPYPLERKTKSGIILSSAQTDLWDDMINIGRVISIGKSAWGQSSHTDSAGNHYNWADVGDFVAWPKHKGAYRIFKGVTYVILNDDDLIEKLPDPLVFDDKFVQINIPQKDLETYNTVYNKAYKGE